MALLVAFVAVLVVTMVQSSVEFGLALVAVPALTLVRFEMLPATVLLTVMLLERL